ncbi:MAG: carboxypeptidase-like regulatory domain-containing protein [Planctomycetota bacterium]
MKNAALLLAIAVALAAAAFFVLSGTDRPTSDSGVTPQSATVTADPETPGAVAELVEVDTESTAERTRSAATAPTAEASTTTAAQRAESESEALGSVVGRVTDGDGRPLEDAEVVLKEAGRSRLNLAMLRSNGLWSRSARTDGEGRFQLDAPAGSVQVTVGLDGYAPFEQRIELAEEAREDVGDLRLAEGVRLRGRVVDSQGQGVSGARITRQPEADGLVIISGGVDEEPTAVTDDNGTFEIARQGVGSFAFDVVHSAHPPGALTGSTERAGDVLDGLVVTLRDGATIEGVVVGLPPSGVEGLNVRASTSGSEGAFTFSTRPGGPVRSNVDAEGRFRLTGLEPGSVAYLTLREGARRFSGSSRRSNVVVAQAGTRDARIEYGTGASIRFRVVDADGAPIESLSVEAGFEFQSERIRSEERSENGECEIASLWPEEGGQKIRLTIRSVGYEPWRSKGLVVQPGEAIDLGNVVLRPRPQVELTVKSAATGAPIEGASVVMRNWRDPSATAVSMTRSIRIEEDDDGREETYETEGEVRGTTDGDGRCLLDAVPGRTVEFFVQAEDHAETVDGPLTVSESDQLTENAIRLEKGGAVLVRVFDANGVPRTGAQVERPTEAPMFGPEEEMSRGETDATGEVLFTGLAAGPTRFRLVPKKLGGDGGIFVNVAVLGGETEEETGWTEVDVVPGETVTLDLLAPLEGVLEGELTEVGVPLAGATITLQRPSDDLSPGLSAFGSQGPKVTTDARGEFRFTGVEEGEYELEIAHSTRAMDEIYPVEVEGAETEVVIDLEVTIVEGVVRDENGEPVAGARVRAERAAVDGPTPTTVGVAVVMTSDDSGGTSMITTGGELGNEVRTDEDGRYSLRGVEAEVELQVVVSADGWDDARSERFEVGEGVTRGGIDVDLEQPGSIVIEIEGGAEGAMAMLRRRGAFAQQPRFQSIIGASTTVDDLAPGTWTVRLLGGPGGTVRTDPDEAEVTVTAGETATVEFEVR